MTWPPHPGSTGETNAAGPGAVTLSIVAPAHNEEENVTPLVEEIVGVLESLDLTYEIIIVDDGSTDETPAILRRLQEVTPVLRVLTMLDTPDGRGHGQSAAFHAGFRASRGELIAVLDADGQNDPADIPGMLAALVAQDAALVQGDRSADRRDNFVKRHSSIIGRFFRRLILGDAIRDTGCSLRLMRRELAMAMPLEFKGLHRFIPVTARALGAKVIEMPVHHRPRHAGETKYGVFERAIPGLIDCFAVRWMRNRRRPTRARSMEAPVVTESAAPTSRAAG